MYTYVSREEFKLGALAWAIDWTMKQATALTTPPVPDERDFSNNLPEGFLVIPLPDFFGFPRMIPWEIITCFECKSFLWKENQYKIWQ